MTFLRLLGLALLFAALSFAAPAAAETTTCTQINSLPTTIGTPGHYCLNFNFAADYATAPININASNVTLDCNGHVVTQIGTAPVAGVFVSNKTQVTVRGCVLVGFGRGIAFFESVSGQSRNHVVEGNRIRKAKLVGILMAGSYNLVADNHVSESTGLAGNASTYGILLTGAGDNGTGNVLRGNTVTGAVPAVVVSVTGIQVQGVTETLLERNVITALYAPTGGYALGMVVMDSAPRTVALGNTVVAAQGSDPPGGGPLTYTGTHVNGLLFYSHLTPTDHSVCRDNHVGFWGDNIEQNPYYGCVEFDNFEF